MSRLRRFTVWHAALLLPWVIAAYGFGRAFNDNSYLWHVRAGDLQIELGHVLTSDPFSFTMEGTPWRTQSWLAELLCSPLDALFGLDAAPLITTVCAAATFILLGSVAYKRTRSVLSVVVYLVLTAIVMAAFINPRPVIFSFPLFAAIVVADDDPRARWVIPLLLWLWAAVHGSFFIGCGYLFLRSLQRGISKRELVRLVAAGIPTLFTAHGIGVLEILRDFASNRDAVELMSEWQAPDLLSPPFLPLFVAILGLIWLAQRGRIRSRDWWLLIPFLVLALTANRSVPPAWIALSPLVSRIEVPLRPTAGGGPAAVVLAAMLAVLPFALRSDEDLDLDRFPVAAAKRLTAERVFHDDAAGGWLVYTQWPQRSVYIDDRAELYGEQMRRFSRVRQLAADWEEEFNRWGISEVLLRVDEPLVRTLRSEGWKTTYEDEYFAILVRG